MSVIIIQNLFHIVQILFQVVDVIRAVNDGIADGLGNFRLSSAGHRAGLMAEGSPGFRYDQFPHGRFRMLFQINFLSVRKHIVKVRQ
ncbi:hypothetical protein SDC9_187300 [bioreactor metagenome]|uniref:Uncharacterized protein n=1 Tax=bioreactor metagenome TaxID=1076179 RepID=A0A645HLV8_9ZZZZ